MHYSGESEVAELGQVTGQLAASPHHMGACDVDLQPAVPRQS